MIFNGPVKPVAKSNNFLSLRAGKTHSWPRPRAHYYSIRNYLRSNGKINRKVQNKLVAQNAVIRSTPIT